MTKKQTITKAYTIFPHHVATIKQTAKDNGQSSDSAALRFIIDDWVRRLAEEAGIEQLVGHSSIEVTAEYADQVSK